MQVCDVAVRGDSMVFANNSTLLYNYLHVPIQHPPESHVPSNTML